MGHAQKPYFVFRRNRRVHLNRRGRQFSRILAAEVCASAVVMLDTPCSEVVWRVLVTHSICQFPLHFPSLCHRVPAHFKWILFSYLRNLNISRLVTPFNHVASQILLLVAAHKLYSVTTVIRGCNYISTQNFLYIRSFWFLSLLSSPAIHNLKSSPRPNIWYALTYKQYVLHNLRICT
jgi:hypothetical protein